MTFVLKDITVLRNHFTMTAEVILAVNHKSSIDDLHEPRRSELLLLAKVLDKIDAKIKEVQTTSRAKTEQIRSQINDLISVYYGAMLLARQDALKHASLTSTGEGKLTSSLDEDLNIKDPEKSNRPSFDDEARFHGLLNKFLQMELFVSGDSRLGFKEDHLLSKIKKDDLQRLLNTSYELELVAQNKVIESLDADSTKKIVPREFSPKKTPDSATISFRRWELLQNDLKELLKEEYISKGKTTLESLAQPRAAQLNFLKQIESILMGLGIDEKEKIAILAGSMHLIRIQIRNEYSTSALSLTTPKSSVVHNKLSELLGVDPDQNIDKAKSQDIEALLRAANRFISYLTVVAKPTSEASDGVKKAIISEHLFKGVKGFDLKETLRLFQEMIYQCRVTSLNNVFEALSLPKSSETRSSLLTAAFGMFGFSGPSAEEERRSAVISGSGAPAGSKL